MDNIKLTNAQVKDLHNIASCYVTYRNGPMVTHGHSVRRGRGRTVNERTAAALHRAGLVRFIATHPDIPARIELTEAGGDYLAALWRSQAQ